MAEVLIEESERQTKVTKGKRKTPFLKEALPGESQTYQPNKYFLGLCEFSAIFFVTLHIFIFIFVYDFWGEFNYSIMFLSLVEICCAVYLFLLAYATDMSFVRQLYVMHQGIYMLSLIVIIPGSALTLLSYIAYQEADHIASYTVTRNTLQFSAAALGPFYAIMIILVVLVDHRSFQIEALDINFEPNYHKHPMKELQASKRSAKKSSSQQSKKLEQKQTRDLTMKLLKSYLEEPTMLSEPPKPDLERQLPVQLV